MVEMGDNTGGKMSGERVQTKDMRLSALFQSRTQNSHKCYMVEEFVHVSCGAKTKTKYGYLTEPFFVVSDS